MVATAGTLAGCAGLGVGVLAAAVPASAAGQAAPPSTSAPAVVAGAAPCGPSAVRGACGTVPTTVTVTWPSAAVVGGVVLRWVTTGRPVAAPAPDQPVVGLADATGACARAADGTTTTCTWPWPAGLETSGQVLDGTYTVAACANDPSGTPVAPGPSTSTTTVPGSSTTVPTNSTLPTSTTTSTTTPPATLLPPFRHSPESGSSAAAPGAATTTPSTTTVPSGPHCDDDGLAGSTIAVAVSPATPAGLQVANGSPNQLRWQPGAEADLAGYVVARDGAAVFTCAEHGATFTTTACPPSPALDDPAPAGSHTWTVTALRPGADPTAPLLASVPATATATSTGTAAPGPPHVPGYVPPVLHATAPATHAGSHAAASTTTTTIDPGFGATLPYATATAGQPAAVPLAQREDGPTARSVGHAALVGLAALLVAVAAHLAYLLSLATRRQAEAAARRRRNG